MFMMIVCLVALPFAVLADVLALRRRWRGVPLQQKNMTRATAGAFVLVVCAVLAVHGFPVVGWQVTAGLAALALLYLVVGIHGSQGARFDLMSPFWWGVLALIAGAALAFRFVGFPL
jgi:hypothetical protein